MSDDLRVMRASSETWCERFPTEGHSWSYVSYGTTPRLEIRHCVLCGYVSVQPILDRYFRTGSEVIDRQIMAAVPLLIDLWQAYLNSTSVEPTEAQIQAGFVQVLDKEGADKIEAACDALYPYEKMLIEYVRQLGEE